MRLRHRGFALILVLIAAAALFALGMQSAVMMRSAMIESSLMGERAKSLREARSAAVLAVSGLLTLEDGPGSAGSSGSPSGGGSPGSSGDGNGGPDLPPIVKEILKAAGKDIDEEKNKSSNQQDRTTQTLTDGGGITGRVPRAGGFKVLKALGLPAKPIDVQLTESGPIYRVRLVDAASQINVNKVESDQLVRYLTGKGIDPLVAGGIADELLDWRDDDDFARPRGAEQAQYTRRGVACRNGKLRSVEELLFLPSMTREIFDLIRDDLSPEGDGKVHAGSASRDVLLSLPGMTGDVVDKIIELREQGRLDKESLDAAIPLAARDSRDLLRLEPSSVIRLRVDRLGNAAESFEGLAALSDRGLSAIGLRPR